MVQTSSQHLLWRAFIPVRRDSQATAPSAVGEVQQTISEPRVGPACLGDNHSEPSVGPACLGDHHRRKHECVRRFPALVPCCMPAFARSWHPADAPARSRSNRSSHQSGSREAGAVWGDVGAARYNWATSGTWQWLIIRPRCSPSPGPAMIAESLGHVLVKSARPHRAPPVVVPGGDGENV